MNRKDRCGGVATLRSKVLNNEPQSMHPEEKRGGQKQRRPLTLMNRKVCTPKKTGRSKTAKTADAVGGFA